MTCGGSYIIKYNSNANSCKYVNSDLMCWLSVSCETLCCDSLWELEMCGTGGYSSQNGNSYKFLCKAVLNNLIQETVREESVYILYLKQFLDAIVKPAYSSQADCISVIHILFYC